MERPQVKIGFPVYDDLVETMWANDLGDGRYRVDNIPWFAYGVSLHDVISVKYLQGDSRPYFDRVIVPSGEITNRITFEENLPEEKRRAASDLLQQIIESASTFSKYSEDYVAIVALDSELQGHLEPLMRSGEQAGYWDWEISTAPETPEAI